MLLLLRLLLLVTALTLLPLQPWHRGTAWPLLLPLPLTEEVALEALEAWVEPVDTTPWSWPTTTVRWAATEEPTVATMDQALVAEETMATRRGQVVETETSRLLPSGVDTDLSLDPQDRTVDRATATAEAITHLHMATAAAVVDMTQEAVAVVATATARVDMVVLLALEVVRVAQDLSAETVAVAVADRPQVPVVAEELITLTNARCSVLGICA
jgi:hypothetical protein